MSWSRHDVWECQMQVLKVRYVVVMRMRQDEVVEIRHVVAVPHVVQRAEGFVRVLDRPLPQVDEPVFPVGELDVGGVPVLHVKEEKEQLARHAHVPFFSSPPPSFFGSLTVRKPSRAWVVRYSPKRR